MMAAAAAMLTVGMAFDEGPRPARRSQRSKTKPRAQKKADRSQKQFLLKGIRP